MRAGRAVAFGAILSFAAAAPLAVDNSAKALEERGSSCPPLYIIVARGSYEPVGEGSMGPAVANVVCAKISGCNSTGVNYPAVMQDSDIYISSEAAGANNMLELAQDFNQQCPNAPIVLMGYSQGAQVVGDTLCGHSEPGWTATSALSGSVADMVIASVQFGDPTFIAGESWNMGTSTHNGVVVRNDPAACDPFASRMKSWCDSGDPYCADGDELSVHTGYMPEYGPAAASFVLEKYSSWVSSSGSTSATSTAQATSTMTTTAQTTTTVQTTTQEPTTLQTTTKSATTAPATTTATTKSTKTHTHHTHTTTQSDAYPAVPASTNSNGVVVDVETVINVVTVMVTARAEPTPA